MPTLGYRIKLHHSLTAPIMLGGAPRRFAIFNGTIGAAFVLGMQLYYLAPLFIVIHVVAVVLAKRDPYFFDIVLKSLHHKKYYRA